MLRTKFIAAGFSLILLSTGMGNAQANLGAASAVAENDEQNMAPNTPDAAAGVFLQGDAIPHAIARVLDQGMTLLESFPAESGLTGWVLSLEGEHTLVYTTAQGDVLISGALLDASGVNLSERYARQYFPKPDIALLEGAAYIRVGQRQEQNLPDSATSEAVTLSDTAKDTVSPGAEMSTALSEEAPVPDTPRVVYAFFDPACPLCHLAWKAFKPYMDQGVELRWIPVAFLAPDSREKAAAILQGTDPQAVMAASMLHFNTGDQPAESVKETSRRQLQNNMKLMQRFGIQGAPGFIWEDDKGVLNIRSGMPKLNELAEITGLPEQPQTDPELFRFR